MIRLPALLIVTLSLLPVDGWSLTKPQREFAERYLSQTDSATARRFKKLKNEQATVFLERYWSDRLPPLGTFYYGFLAGRTHLNVSQSFFNDERVMPKDYWVILAAPDPRDLSGAADLLGLALEDSPDDALAWAALGYVRLEQDRHNEAEAALMSAMRINRRWPAVHHGLGLAKMKFKGRRRQARDHFRDAIALDRDYEEATFNLAQCHLAMSTNDLDYQLGKVTKRFPDHDDAYFKRGVWFERRGELDGQYLKEAQDAYTVQLSVAPGHNAARVRLAGVELGLGNVVRAVSLCRLVLDQAPEYRVQGLSTLLAGYQALGEIALADSVGSLYVERLPAGIQVLFKDVTRVASLKENRVYDALPYEERDGFTEAFWTRHDPTPGSPGNAKRVEHYRRVGYALTYYSESAEPWDQRGEVYVRYGEPAHKSRSGNMRFETDPQVVRVKDRLFGTLNEDEKREIYQLHRRIRSSSRDPDYDNDRILVSDFESAEFEFESVGALMGRGVQRQPGDRYDRNHFVSPSDRMGVSEIRGVPLFPIESGRPWEYWIYPDVVDGVEIVFMAMYKGGAYEFATPPGSGRAISQENATGWQLRRSDHTIASAVKRQPSILRLNRKPLPFIYDTATFRVTDDTTRLEIYFGIPLRGQEDTDKLEASAVVFDSRWTTLGEVVAPVHVVEGDTMGLAEVYVGLPAGTDFILALQAANVETRASTSVKTALPVAGFGSDSLRLSDLEFASHVDLDAGLGTKDGMRVIPRPGRVYGPGEAVRVYYEIYGLSRDAFDQNRYRVEYTVEPLDGGNLVARVAGGIARAVTDGGRKVIEISYERTGVAGIEHETIEIDVGGSEPGTYRLRVNVTDVVGSTSYERENTFVVTKG
jgi:GWxTD domain-containing protein